MFFTDRPSVARSLRRPPLAAAVVLVAIGPRPAQATNYLLIIGDDIGVDKVSGYTDLFDGTTDAFGDTLVDGSPHLPATPTLDTLAAGGMRFTQAWASPVCTPTRGAINTGLHPHRNDVLWPGDELDILGYTMIADLMSDSGGLATGLFGKWHLGQTGVNGTTTWSDPALSPILDDTHPSLAGYDRFYGTLEGEVENYDDWLRVSDTSMVNRSWVANETDWATEATIDVATSWINSRTTDWFAVVSFHVPHADADGNWDYEDVNPDCVPAGALRDCIQAGVDGVALPPSCSGDEELTVYQGMVECMDAQIGQLLDAIPDVVLEDTIVTFMGDNGTPNAVAEWLFEGAGRGKKSAYETGVRVPLIIADGATWTGAAPTLVTSGARDVTLSTHVVDLYNTFAEHALGFTIPIVDSVSLADCFSQGGASCGRLTIPTANYSEASNDAGQRMAAVKSLDFKLVIHYDASSGCLDDELYNIGTDYFEESELTSGLFLGILRGDFVARSPDWAIDPGTGLLYDWCL